MKKSISRALALLLAIMFLFQGALVSYADDELIDDWQDISLTDSEIDDIIALNPQASPRATGLIHTYGIGVTSSGSSLIIAGKTLCNSDVTKCGFTIVTVQHRKSSQYSWTDYRTYEDLYLNNTAYTLGKTISVATGYQYRVTCTHYAKKNILTTQKINNTSNVIYI